MPRKVLVVAIGVVLMQSAQAAPPRQVVQAGPSGTLAVSKDGYVAVVDGSSTLHLYQLASRTLVRSISASTLEAGAGLVHPVNPVWDEVTGELLLARGGDQLAVAIDGTLTTRPHNTTRLWPVGGGGKARWISRLYGDAQVLDASWNRLGALSNSESLAVAADGKSVVVATATALERFTLDPIAKHQTIALPMPPLRGMSAARVAVTSDGRAAVVCVSQASTYQAILVRDLDRTPRLIPLAWPDMIGCEIAIAEPHGVVAVASVGELRGFDLATGAQRWVAPRDYGIATGSDGAIGIHNRTLIVSWRGLVLVDVVRGDVIGQVGTELAAPDSIWFLKGDQLLAVRDAQRSVFSPPAVDLATWSLKHGLRTHAGSASWGHRVRIGEDGALTTLRIPKADPANPCWTFARGTTADGAPAGVATVGTWPPLAKQGRAICVPGSAQVVGADLARGALAVYDQQRHQVISIAGTTVHLDDAKAPKLATALTFSPDGAWVVGGAMRGSWASLHVWDVKRGAHRWFSASASDPETVAIGGPPRKGYTASAFSADSKELAIAGSDTVTVYTVQTRRAARTFSIPSAHLTAVALWSATTLAGTSDGRLVIARANRIATATSDGGAIQQIAIRSDGKRAATISDDGAIRIWDLAKPALLATLVEATDGESFASTPGGAYAGGREASSQLGWIFDGPTEGFAFERFAGQLARPDIVAKRLADATTDLGVTIVRPPHVTITRQPPPVGTTVELGVRVAASTGAVAVVRAFVNGRAAASVDVRAAVKDVVIAVPLEAGSNVVTVVAFDDAGRASNPRSVDVGTAPASTRPDVWVVAAGVGWYPNLPVEDQLEGSVNDAYAIADAFDGQAGPGKRYDKAHITVLEDEQVTAQALDQALARLAQMKPTDVAVVFLAGHGVRLPKTDDMVLLTGAAKPDPATWAASGIGWHRIGAALAQAKGRVIVLLDACHAGNVTQERIVPNTQLADDLVSSQRAGVLVFAASKGSQKSLEANAARGVTLDADQQVQVRHKRVPKQPPPPPVPATPTAPRERRGNGYFTGAVVAALDSPITDLNRDGAVQTTELITQVQLRVLRASRGKQTPWVARRELFGDFALATSAK